MNQREQPYRACKSRKQTGSTACGHSADSSDCESVSSIDRRSNAPSPVCPLFGSHESSSAVLNKLLSDSTKVSKSVVFSSGRESDNTLVDSFESCERVSLPSNAPYLKSYPGVESSSSVSTVPYSMAEDEDSGRDLNGTGNMSTPMFDMKSLFREFFNEFGRSGLVSSSSREGSGDAEMSRQITALAPHKDGMDISKYITKLEADLTDIGCPQGRWRTILLQKLQSKSASAIVAGIDRETTDYSQLKEILIESLGSSLTGLGIKLTSDFANSTRSMNPLEKYVHLKSLTDSIAMQCSSVDELLLFVACATYRASCSPVQRSLMDQREFHTFRDLNKFALSINTGELERQPNTSGRFNKFRSYPPRECFKCHKFGHRAFECRSSVSDCSPPTSSPSSGSSGNTVHANVTNRPPGIVCYTCHEPGHKSPDCPTKRNSDGNGDSGKRAGVRRNRTYNLNWISVSNGSPSVVGFVNGSKCKIVPDTGAEISVVPGCLVYGDQLTGEKVNVKGWDGRPVTLDIAIVDFTIKGCSFNARVAVAHADSLCGCVLFSIPMEQGMAEQLLLDAASKSDLSGLEAGQLRDTRSIQPPAQVGAGSGIVAEEGPSPTSSASVAIPDELYDVRAVTRSKSKLSPRSNENDNSSDLVDDEFQRLSAVDVPYEPPSVGVGSNVGSSEVDLLSGSDEDGIGINSEGSASSEGNDGASPPSESVADIDVPVDLNFDIPKLSDVIRVEDLKSAVLADDTLIPARKLAVECQNGYSFVDDVLFHSVLMDDVLVKRIVVPKCHRLKILTLAHDKCAHVGVRGMRAIINKRFTWPGIHGDVMSFVKSCDVCLRVNSQGNRKSKIVERKIVSVPFESVAVDIVGPLPNAKRGVKYLFTYICLASRWPEALPMRTASAPEAAQCFMDIVSRTGIPLKVLSDRGTVFLSKLMSNMYTLLGIDSIATSPYRPQSNGVVERLHGTLKPMLAKAADTGIDWSVFLPLALFAIRQVPNRDVGFSPHELVYGKNVLGPLDILYRGWASDDFEELCVDEWLLKLSDRLSLLHDLAVNNESDSSKSRALSLNKHRQDTPLEVGSLVLMRIPGMKSAFQASWEGPYRIVGRSSRVSYKVSKGEDHPTKLAHRDNLKLYVPRPLSVNAVTLIAEEQGIDHALLNCKATLTDDKCPGFRKVDLDAVLSDLKAHFSDSPGLCVTGTCKIELVENAKVVNLPPRQIPAGIREAVQKEIQKLLSDGIIVESTSEWASPLVPVRKKDGSVRICVDFRCLNSVTPLRRYWLPSLTEILEQVGPHACLSTLDLTARFHQLAMDESSSELTTFVCPFGKYKYLRMPFGLKNAPAIFQAVIESVLKPVSSCCRNYVDDVVIYSRTWHEHLTHLRQVIGCLSASGLTIKLRKCCFGRKHLLYLGHKIGAGLLAVPEHRVSSLAGFAKPVTKKQLRSFLGTVSYYRRFIPSFADCSGMLTPATSLKAPLQIVWTEEMTACFRKLKSLLCSACVLIIPAPDDTFILHTDASGVGIGGCLHVKRSERELPVGFFSRQLKAAERNYSVTELEGLAIIASLQYFEYFLYAKEVTVVTDHKPCLALLNGTGLNKRLLRFALALQSWQVTLIHRPGRAHSNADGMSRQAWSESEDNPAHEVDIRFAPSQILEGGDVGGEEDKRK